LTGVTISPLYAKALVLFGRRSEPGDPL
jgi:hypothetical protein